MKLEFDDGVTFETSGKMRVVKKFDGYYAVGRGMLMPAADFQEAIDLCKEFEAEHKEEESDVC
jgi:isopenicillin N synthase-like dioxygenase